MVLGLDRESPSNQQSKNCLRQQPTKTKPKTTHGKLSRKEVEERKGNLVFFGNFHKMSLEDYEWGMGELMQDRDFLYKSLTRDLYFLGKVLNRKYNLLRYSYYTFVVGLVISIAMFVINLREVMP